METVNTQADEPAGMPAGFGNPLPLGLLGYGMSTVLLSFVNAGVYEMGTAVLAMAVLFGGVAQLVVAIMAFRRNDSFAVTAFGGYAFLWLTLGFLMIGADHGWGAENSGSAMGWYLFVWALFSFGLFIGSFTLPRFLTLVLGLTVALLLLLAVGNWFDSTQIVRIGGWEGIVTGASAIYLAFAFLLNEMFGRTILPVGGPLAQPTAPPTPVGRPAPGPA
ncbi:MAG TPA: acetate uptake transporter [Longimicrobiaceae bacterium]|nr:acetate uptake transporter [Longimicrobiaceae bacterium]